MWSRVWACAGAQIPTTVPLATFCEARGPVMDAISLKSLALRYLSRSSRSRGVGLRWRADPHHSPTRCVVPWCSLVNTSGCQPEDRRFKSGRDRQAGLVERLNATFPRWKDGFNSRIPLHLTSFGVNRFILSERSESSGSVDAISSESLAPAVWRVFRVFARAGRCEPSHPVGRTPSAYL
jgi:hypothetical protein